MMFKDEGWPVAYQESDKLAIAIAKKVFPNERSERARELAKLLCDFADEIRRSAIEP